MAKRTLRRNPLSVDTDDYDLNEQYANFAEFKGLNTNKNYITVDQNSFEDVKNVYVDQDQQLHTRPPLKYYNLLPTTDHVVQIIKVNNLTIYHVERNGQYLLEWLYDGNIVTTPVGWVYEEVKIINKRGLYIVFTQGIVDNETVQDLKGFELLNGQWQRYDAEDIVYIPTTEIHSGGDVNESENSNLLTGTHIIQYIFDINVNTPTFDLINQEVKINFNDGTTPITVTFTQDMEKVFAQIINKTAIDVDILEVKKIADTDILYYLGYKKTEAYCFISVDGGIFQQINYPTATCKTPVLADDGSALYICDMANAIIYVMNITSSSTGITLGNWQSIQYELPEYSVNTAYQAPVTNNGMLSTKFYNVRLASDYRPLGHSPETGKACFYVPCLFDDDTYKNSVNGYSETGGSTGERNQLGFALLILLDGKITSYLVVKAALYSSNELRQYDGDKIRMIVGGDNFNMVLLNLYNYSLPFIVFDVNWNPYYRIVRENWENGPVYVEYVNESIWGNNLKLYYNQDFYKSDLITYYDQTLSRYVVRAGGFPTQQAGITYSEGLTTNYCENVRFISGYDSEDYALHYTYPNSNDMSGNRETYPINADSGYDEEEWSDVGDYVRISDTANFLGNESFHYNGKNIPLLRPTNTANILPIFTDGDIIVYYDKVNYNLYSTVYIEPVYVSIQVKGDLNLLYPDLLADFITIVMSKDNILYWSTDATNTVTLSDGTEHIIPALYFEKESDTVGNWVNLPDEITALTVFAQTSLGVFLPNNVYEFQYNVDNDIYLLTPTKLQLGNRKGSEVLGGYDGATIFITNIKGLIGLTYQDFVQSTEQIYSYLTENIMSNYDKFADAPIKLYQYKDWLFMYKQNSPNLYLYDIKNTAWWYWENPYNIKQIVFDGDKVNVLTDTDLLYYDFDTSDFLDLDVHEIDWLVKSQKLHFGAPNNYKHIRQLVIITSQNTDTLRYKLKFINYHNLQDLVDVDTVEYDITQLTTMIKRVTFMKLNAFQFVISNDNTDPKPKYFATPNIAIKYRITERVR